MVIQLDDAGPIAVPGPTIESTHRLHHTFAQHVEQRASKQQREGIRKEVHSNVVVRPAFAGWSPVYFGALAKALHINSGRFTPKLTLPLARLLQ